MNEYRHLHYTVEQFIGHVQLDRPPVNALGRELIQELTTLAEQINREAEAGAVRAVVLTAAGKHFCAGADLKERQNLPADQVAAAVDATRAMTSAVASIIVPTIAAIQGYAVGGGMELALAADLRIVAASAKMGLRETALAIIPGAGGTQRLPRLIGLAAALLWITTGRIFSADDCLRFGVAQAVVADDELLVEVAKLAQEIAANGPIAVRAAKEAVIRGVETSIVKGLQIEGECYRKVIPTRDRLEALAAFAEKRPPIFTGQ